jgi:hypothetical protein
VSTKLDGWKAVSCHTLTENVGHLLADCVNPRTVKWLALYATPPCWWYITVAC